ncbi:MAG: hypothetical protein JWM85_1451, partial [Acidimicrobiaceae bacterium]|nr:hypothetical protein [Acidimicrobiaceae bacterium]
GRSAQPAKPKPVTRAAGSKVPAATRAHEPLDVPWPVE